MCHVFCVAGVNFTPTNQNRIAYSRSLSIDIDGTNSDYIMCTGNVLAKNLTIAGNANGTPFPAFNGTNLINVPDSPP